MNIAERLLRTLWGIKPPAVEPPLRELNPFEQRMSILRAKWDRERPTEPEEQEPAVVYTPLSALMWLGRTERKLGRAVTTAEILLHCAGVKYPTYLACLKLARCLRKAGAKSSRFDGGSHLRWSRQ